MNEVTETGPPALRGGHWVWSDRKDCVEVRFVGRGPGDERDETLRRIGDAVPGGVAWPRQIHGDGVLGAEKAGLAGAGDAVWSRRRDLALAVVTADCVPVLLAGDEVVAAVHAGWRGIEAEVVAATLDRLGSDPSRLTAWIGPAIGPCCYEVGDDVAARVAAASDGRAVITGPGQRPHLDLARAVGAQLAAGGVGKIRQARACTRCADERLWSYRRLGKGAGRNLAYVWRSGRAAAPRGSRPKARS